MTASTWQCEPTAAPDKRSYVLTVVCTCSNNAIDLEGTKALAAALAANTTLKSIILSDNYIGVEGAKALAEVSTQHHQQQQKQWHVEGLVSGREHQPWTAEVHANVKLLSAREAPIPWTV
jgi:Ran GTPase-activating protein (RanGAP) involved in mRNA processing and transport